MFDVLVIDFYCVLVYGAGLVAVGISAYIANAYAYNK